MFCVPSSVGKEVTNGTSLLLETGGLSCLTPPDHVKLVGQVSSSGANKCKDFVHGQQIKPSEFPHSSGEKSMHADDSCHHKDKCSWFVATNVTGALCFQRETKLKSPCNAIA